MAQYHHPHKTSNYYDHHDDLKRHHQWYLTVSSVQIIVHVLVGGLAADGWKQFLPVLDDKGSLNLQNGPGGNRSVVDSILGESISGCDVNRNRVWVCSISDGGLQWSIVALREGQGVGIDLIILKWVGVLTEFGG